MTPILLYNSIDSTGELLMYIVGGILLVYVAFKYLSGDTSGDDADD